MKGPPLGPGGEDITWPNQVAPRGRNASSIRKIKPQTSNVRQTSRDIILVILRMEPAQSQNSRWGDRIPPRILNPIMMQNGRSHREGRQQQEPQGILKPAGGSY